MSGDSLREVGKISHGWDRELVNFTTTLVFPETAVQPKHKALLLAATFLMVINLIYIAKFSKELIKNKPSFVSGIHIF